MNHQRPRFPRFLDLTQADIDCDFHLHTNRTDGEADVGDIIEAAGERGLKQIGITEHVRKETNWFKSFAKDVRATAKHHPDVRVFVGCEAKALDMKGSLDVTEETLGECDVVLGSVHRFPDRYGGFMNFASLTREACARIEFLLALGLATSAPIDVLAHPGGMLSRRFGTDLPTDMLEELIEKCQDRDIAIEINSSYLRNVDGFLDLCSKHNPRVSIGSDMHQLEQLGQCRDLLTTKGRFL